MNVQLLQHCDSRYCQHPYQRWTDSSHIEHHEDQTGLVAAIGRKTKPGAGARNHAWKVYYAAHL